MFCGTKSFHHFGGDDPPATKVSKKTKKQKKNKNPYSSRGLDKFTSVLSELEARREKIMASTGTQGIAMIRFMYSNSQDWIPIIVRLRDNSSNNNNNNQIVAIDASPKKPTEVATPTPPQPPAVVKRRSWWKWRSSYCMPVMVVLILVCLVIFGRVFAICCTSIWWYLVPTLQGEEGRRMKRRVSRKKDYEKKMSDKRLPAATVQELASPRAHGSDGKRG